MPKASPQLQYYYRNKAKCNQSGTGRLRRYKVSDDPEEREKYRRKIKRAVESTKAWRKNNPEAHKIQSKRNHLKQRFGITLEDYEAKLKSQDNRCALCGDDLDEKNKPDSPHLDHCHKTNKIRGIVHQHCNHLLGCARDDKAILKKAIIYLELYN